MNHGKVCSVPPNEAAVVLTAAGRNNYSSDIGVVYQPLCPVLAMPQGAQQPRQNFATLLLNSKSSD